MGLHFTSTRLVGKNKRGVIRPDEDGYYTLPVGALNTFNSAGEYYTADGEGAANLFKSSSVFMRRVRAGALRAENGHPDYVTGMSDDEYLSRILEIRETNVVGHFKDIWLDEDFGKKHPELDNPNLIAIMAKVIPSGEKAHVLRSSLENPHEETCFSIRSLTRDYVERGKRFKELKQIITFDMVNEPGIYIARKSFSPMLESRNLGNEGMFENIDKIVEAMDGRRGFATEDSRFLAMETISIIRREQNKHTFSDRKLSGRW